MVVDESLIRLVRRGKFLQFFGGGSVDNLDLLLQLLGEENLSSVFSSPRNGTRQYMKRE